MPCPHCGRPGRKEFQSYCTKVHRDLDKKPERIILECASCGRPVVRTSSQVSGKVFCQRCPKNQGETHPRWKEGQYLNPAGYRLILVNSAYILEHRFVWEQVNKASLLPEAQCVIHHINFDKLDNRGDNLLLVSNEEHGRLHRYIDAKRYVDAGHLLLKLSKRQLCFPKNTILMMKQWMLNTPTTQTKQLESIVKSAIHLEKQRSNTDTRTEN